MPVPQLLPVDPADPDPAAIARAAAVLRAGGLVGLPTETVYGLAASARDPAAVARVFAAKNRPADNPLIVHVADPADLDGVAASVPPLARRLAARWWPGPLTLVVEAAGDLPPGTTGGLRTVAVRMPDHPVALAVVRAAQLPLAAPSANRSGRPSPTLAEHVVAELGADVDVVLDAGACRWGVESTVVDARSDVPIILRAGAISAEQLDARLPNGGAGDAAAASPGTRYRHYAPSCRVLIAPVDNGPEVAAGLPGRVGLVSPAAAPPHVVQLARPADAVELARLLFRALRQAEDAGLDVVVVEAVDEDGLGAAVMDRLRRAAAAS